MPTQLRRRLQSTHQMEINNSTQSTTDEEPDSYQLFNLQEPHNEPLKITMLVNQKQLQMEIDTGAALSLISEKTFKTVGYQQELKPSNIKLRIHTYTKESIDACFRLHGSNSLLQRTE